MLTKADDYPIHQTPDTIAHTGTDRNFYDRFFFCGWSPDGKVYVAAAMGLYPNLDLIDAAVSIAVDGVQHSVFASRILHSERLDLAVGPIRIEIVEPLASIRLVVTDNDHGITADFVFRTVFLPVEEERHHMRHGPRTVFDLTRMSIFGTYEGWARIDDRLLPMEGYRGLRDRSWGVRDIGARDPQPRVPAVDLSAVWIWVPVQFEDRALLFVELDGGGGKILKRRAEIVHSDGVETLSDCRLDARFDPVTRRARSVRISGRSERDGSLTIDTEPSWAFPLIGVGYEHPDWMHGAYHGPRAVHGERRQLDMLDPLAPGNRHVHSPAKATMLFEDGRTLTGRGTVEQLVFGDHPYEGLHD